MLERSFDARRLPPGTLRSCLVAERPGLSPADRAALSDGPDLRRDTGGGVRSWVDAGHVVTHRSGRVTATRAITDSGLLTWMVRVRGEPLAFHSDREGVDDAFREAAEARRARAAIAARWDEYRALRRRVLLGARKLTVTLGDARRAGLCELGVQALLHRLGLGGRTRLPGRPLAALSYLDRRAGHAVFAAHLRQQAEEAATRGEAERAAPPPGAEAAWPLGPAAPRPVDSRPG